MSVRDVVMQMIVQIHHAMAFMTSRGTLLFLFYLICSTVRGIFVTERAGTPFQNFFLRSP
jgi:hypothetical protein